MRQRVAKVQGEFGVPIANFWFKNYANAVLAKKLTHRPPSVQLKAEG